MENIDDLFKRNLDDFSKEPPAYVWDNINTVLEKQNRRKKRRGLWLFFTLAGLLIAFGVGYFTSLVTAPKTSQVADFPFHYNTHSGNQPNINSSSQQDQQNTITQYHSATNTQTSPDNLVKEHKTSSKQQRSTASGTTSKNPWLAMPKSSLDLFGVVENSGNGHIPSGAGKHTQITQEPKENIQPGTEDAVTSPVVEHPQIIASESIVKTEKTIPSTNTALTGPETGNKTCKVGGRFFIEAYGGPQYVSRNSFRPDPLNLYQPFFGANEDFSESYRFSWNVGLNAGFRIWKGLYIKTGINYNEFTHTISRDKLQVKYDSLGGIGADQEYMPVYTSAGDIDGLLINLYGGPDAQTPEFTPENFGKDSLQHISQQFAAVEIPLMIGYRFGKRFGFSIQAGATAGFITRNSVTIHTERFSYDSGATRDIKSFYLNGIFGVGFDYQIMPSRLSVFLDPTIRYSFTNWSSNPEIKMNPLYFSGNLGLRVNF